MGKEATSLYSYFTMNSSSDWKRKSWFSFICSYELSVHAYVLKSIAALLKEHYTAHLISVGCVFYIEQIKSDWFITDFEINFPVSAGILPINEKGS